MGGGGDPVSVVAQPGGIRNSAYLGANATPPNRKIPRSPSTTAPDKPDWPISVTGALGRAEQSRVLPRNGARKSWIRRVGGRRPPAGGLPPSAPRKAGDSSEKRSGAGGHSPRQRLRIPCMRCFRTACSPRPTPTSRSPDRNRNEAVHWFRVHEFAGRVEAHHLFATPPGDVQPAGRAEKKENARRSARPRDLH